MNTIGSCPPQTTYASDNESSHFLGSFNSATETDSDVPGPGRLLGKAYGFLGKIAEDYLSVIALKLGRGPEAAAMKVRRLIQAEGTVKPGKEKELERAGRRLVKYVRSNVASTQDVALSEVINLAFEDEQLRLLLKTECIRSIGLLRQDRSVWYNMPKPIQSRAHRTLIALGDENANIKDFVGSLQTIPLLAWPLLKPKLEACLLNESYCFVATRHLRRVKIDDSSLLNEVVELLLACLYRSTDAIEWAEYDEVLATHLSAYIQFTQHSYLAFEYLSEHSLFLPKTFNSDIVQNVISGFDSEDIDIVVWSYTVLSSLEVSYDHVNPDNLSVGFHPNASKLYKKLANPPDHALATICSNALVHFQDDENTVSSACRMLAELMGSEEESVRRQALRNARVALRVNRYIRQEMIAILSGTSQGPALINETETLCRPSDCPGRARPGEVCKRHGDLHDFFLYRHCDAYGNLIHLDGSHVRCKGDCGATEEHVMRHDKNDLMWIGISRDEPFVMDDHYPLIAGRLPDGRSLYAFQLYEEDELHYLGTGPTPEEVRFLQRRSDGNHILAGPSPSGELSVQVLRYDPDAYILCDHYADKIRSEEFGMDPTGPFSWKLHGCLPAVDKTYASIEAYIAEESLGSE